GERPPRRAEHPIPIEDRARIAIDAGLVADAHLRAGAEQIELLELEARGVLAALAAKRQPGVESPHVLRRHLEVHDAVVPRHRRDPGVAQVARAAQDARRFLDEARVVDIAGLEKELILDRALAGLDVKSIRNAAEPGVLILRGAIEE